MGESFAVVFLKRRAICRAAIVTAFCAFLLIQLVRNVVWLLQLPPWVMQAFLLFLAVIFVPTFIIAAWRGGPQTHEEALEWHRFQAARNDAYAEDYLKEGAEREKRSNSSRPKKEI